MTELADRISSTYEAFTAALTEQARLELLEIANDHPGVTEFSFEHESVYDDEGSYYDNFNTAVDVNKDVPGQQEAFQTLWR